MKAVESAEEQIAAAKRRNEAAVKFLEDHIAQDSKPQETAPVVEETAAEPAVPTNETPQIVESDLSPEAAEKPVEPANNDSDLDSVNDALGLGDIFKIFKN